MKRSVKILSVCTALALAFGGIAGLIATSVGASAESEAQTTTVVVTSPFTQAIADVRDSVVGVNNYQNVRRYGYGYGYGYGRGSSEPVLYASGSGVVIAKGYVLTNQHVVENAAQLKISIIPDGADSAVEYEATLVTSDADLDLAIVYCPRLTAEPVKLGDSDTLQVGDWAICIGNPLSDSFYGTVTAGIVSGLNRAISSTSYDRYGRRETITNTMIQVDAAINSGNSGGGMFSVTGELMGIPTMKYSGTLYSGMSIDGIAMCIPINVAKPMIDDVLSGVVETPAVDEETEAQDEGADKASSGLTGKPRLGVTIAGLNPYSTDVVMGIIPNGVYVREVDKNSPADAAGMKAGDIIVEAEGTVITTVSQLQNIIKGYNEGDTLSIRVYRAEGMADAVEKGLETPTDGEYVDLSVTLRIVDDVKQ